jgi:hypothetical protein
MQAAGTQVIANSGHDDMIVCLPDATTTTTSSSSPPRVLRVPVTLRADETNRDQTIQTLLRSPSNTRNQYSDLTRFLSSMMQSSTTTAGG